MSLLERIVACASPPGGLVVDLFGGSGTTGEAAHALGRSFVLGDGSPLAIAASRARLLRAGIELTVAKAKATASVPSGPAPEVALGADGDFVRVELLAPSEPLAWAVGITAEGEGTFRTMWHSERAPGMRARAAERVARVARVPGPTAARVWYDDGRIATLALGSA
jgi:hypothetical protein